MLLWSCLSSLVLIHILSFWISDFGDFQGKEKRILVEQQQKESLTTSWSSRDTISSSFWCPFLRSSSVLFRASSSAWALSISSFILQRSLSLTAEIREARMVSSPMVPSLLGPITGDDRRRWDSELQTTKKCALECRWSQPVSPECVNQVGSHVTASEEGNVKYTGTYLSDNTNKNILPVLFTTACHKLSPGYYRTGRLY